MTPKDVAARLRENGIWAKGTPSDLTIVLDGKRIEILNIGAVAVEVDA